MHYKKIIIIFLFSSIFSQSLFNRIFPEQYHFGDARSMGIGNTYLTTCTTSMLVLSNPAKLARINRNLHIQSNFLSISERRSRIIKDNWGDFLAETDYVFNQNNYFINSTGFILNTKNNDKNNLKFGIGYIYTPIYSLNYNYEEEVRSDADLQDGIIGIDDPIIGYHTYSTEGNIAVHSLGFSIYNDKQYNYAIGISVNQIQSTEIKDDIYINIIDPAYYIDNNIATAEEEHNVYEISGITLKDYYDEYYFTFSLELINKNVELTLSYEQDAIIKSKEDYDFINVSNQIGLPLFFNMDSNNELNYLINGLQFNKPKKISFGFLYSPKNRSNLSIAFEMTGEKWKVPLDANNIYMLNKNIMEYRFGFEYSPFKSFPIRAGLMYSESLLITDPISTLTLGTGKKFGRVSLDLAMNYSTYKYNYYDLFPEDDIFDMSCDLIQCDKVREDKLSFLTTIKVDF